MTGFSEMFQFAFAKSEDEPAEQPEPARPSWFGPPDDELGVAVAQQLVVGRSDRAVVALRHVIVYSAGVELDFAAAARGLSDRESNRLFHDQHHADPEDLPDEFLRVGIELADGARVSNLRGRRWPRDEPDGPVLVQSGGRGGSGGGGRVFLQAAYWLWPLPGPGTIQVFAEWPALGVELSRAEVDTAPLLAAAPRAQPLWAD